MPLRAKLGWDQATTPSVPPRLAGADWRETGRGGQVKWQGKDEPSMLRIALTSVLVDDQDKALAFYTEVLGFVMKRNIPAGDFKFLTVVSPAGPDDVELLLEPNDNPAARTFQAAIREQGIPATSFAVEDIEAEYERLTGLGVAFRSGPTAMGPVTTAVFDDTCGNLIQLHQA